MSQTRTTQTTKSSTSSDSSPKRRGRPPKTIEEPKVEEPKVEVKDPVMKTVNVISSNDVNVAKPNDHENRMKVAEMMVRLETSVTYAKSGGFEWLEVDKEVLEHFCRGQMPGSGYYVYKGIKLCLAGQASDLARKENQDVHAIVFKEDAKKINVGSVKK